MYTSELTKIHRHFFHPHPDRLFSLMKRAEDPEATPNIHRQLNELARSSDICQRLFKEPSRFRCSLPSEDIVFNRTVYMDLTKLDSTQCLHIVDKDTLFNAAVFLMNGENTDDVWHAYLRSWVIPYIGYSERIHADQGPRFTSDRWASLLTGSGIKKDESGIESHNLIGAGERYHAFLKQIYRKVRAELPNIGKEYALALTVKAMNETAGPNGLSPVLLFFGVHPRMPLPTTDLPNQRERMKALKLARSEMVKAVAKSRLSTAQRSNVPGASDSLIEAGTEVLVYREKPKEWIGPYRVLSIDEKQVILDINNQQKVYSIDKVKKYYRPTISHSSTQPNTSPPLPSPSPNPHGQFDFNAPVKGIISSQTPGTSPPQTASAPPLSGQYNFGAAMDRIIAGDVLFHRIQKSIQNARRDGNFVEDVDGSVPAFLTEVFKPGDEPEHTKQFAAAKQTEIDGLLDRGTFMPIDKRDVPTDANILGGRFVCALKNKGTDQEKPKARYVAQGHRDKEKPFIVHNITTLRQSSVKIIVSTCAVRNFRIFSHDVTKAYLQTDENLSREIYLKPKKEDLHFFQITEDHLLRLIRSLYGVSDAGDYWGVTFDRHVQQKLDMKPLETDSSLYLKEGEEDLDGVLGAYVDDCVLGGNKEFQDLTEGTLRRFESKPREWDNVEFLGVSIKTTWIETDYGRTRIFYISQPDHLSKVRKIPLDISFDFFRSVRASFAWLAHSRPDVYSTVQFLDPGIEPCYSQSKIIVELKSSVWTSRQRNTPY